VKIHTGQPDILTQIPENICKDQVTGNSILSTGFIIKV